MNELSRSDGKAGVIWVRGHSINDLVENHGCEGTVAILWDGFAGDGLTRAKMQRELGSARKSAFAQMRDWFDAGARRPLLEGVRIALAALPEDFKPAAIAATLPVALAALIREREGKAPVEPDQALPTAADVRALETYFTVVCENGLGSSSFAGRVAISTQSSLVSAVVAAYCAFTGPLHGGAPGPALDLLDEIAASGDVAGCIERKLAAGERLMGFGHRVFRLRDPRAGLLRAAAASLEGSAARIAFAMQVERAAVAALNRRRPGYALHANIEMDAGLLLEAVGVPRDAFTQVFAIARCPSWIAHALEQRKTRRMIRPTSRYVGP